MRPKLPRTLVNLVGLAAAWLIIFGVFSYFLPQSFPTVRNLETIARQSAITSLAAIGMTYVIVSGGIDLSVGSIAAFVSVVIATALLRGMSPVSAMALGVASGAVWGFLNGLIITRLRVTPFIVTLGTLLIVRGAAKGLGKEQSVYPPPTWLNDLLASLGANDRWKLLAPGVWITLALAVLVALILRYTRFGRHVIAIGSNENAARLCGVAIERVKLSVYVVSGLFAGLAGLMLFSRLNIGDPTSAQQLELDAIAAVVIGGASLAGGEGSIAGSLLGALVMTTIRAGGSQMALPNWVQEIVTGAIIVLAVALDRLRVARSR